MTTTRPDLVADCRMRATLDLLVHTWDPVVLAALGNGRLRRERLRRSIGGETGLRDKPLTEALARLVARGLVARHEPDGRASHVEYELTALGCSFHDGPLTALGQWTLAHADQLDDQAPGATTSTPCARAASASRSS